MYREDYRMRDRERERDRARDRERDRMRGGYSRDRERGRDYDYNDYGNYDYDYDYRDRENYNNYDYHSGNQRMTERELMDKSKQFLNGVDSKAREYFSLSNIERKSKELGIDYSSYDFNEFYTTALMLYSDFSKTLGTINFDIYLKLARDWLDDKDSMLKGGKKLCAYFDKVVDPY